MDLTAALLILAGSILAPTSALGIVPSLRQHRPDTLTRMHAAAKPQALSLMPTPFDTPQRRRP